MRQITQNNPKYPNGFLCYPLGFFVTQNNPKNENAQKMAKISQFLQKDEKLNPMGFSIKEKRNKKEKYILGFKV